MPDTNGSRTGLPPSLAEALTEVTRAVERALLSSDGPRRRGSSPELRQQVRRATRIARVAGFPIERIIPLLKHVLRTAGMHVDGLAQKDPLAETVIAAAIAEYYLRDDERRADIGGGHAGRSGDDRAGGQAG